MIAGKMPRGMMVEMKGDGKLWTKKKMWGSLVVDVPLSRETMVRQLGGLDEDLKPTVLGGRVFKKWVLPKAIMRRWAAAMVKLSDGECLMLYGRNERGQWMAVVPKQEVTGASVDLDDSEPAVVKLAEMGYGRVGAIHTHPGNSSTMSGVDRNDLFPKMGGLHYIFGRSGGWTRYMTVEEEVFMLDSGQDRVWSGEEDRLFDGIVAEDGGELERMITRPIVTVYGGNVDKRDKSGWVWNPLANKGKGRCVKVDMDVAGYGYGYGYGYRQYAGGMLFDDVDKEVDKKKAVTSKEVEDKSDESLSSAIRSFISRVGEVYDVPVAGAVDTMLDDLGRLLFDVVSTLDEIGLMVDAVTESLQDDREVKGAYIEVLEKLGDVLGLIEVE